MRSEANPTKQDILQASPRMFENPILDRLSRVHPSVPVVVYGPLILVLLVLSGPAGVGAMLGWFLFGYLCWTLVEYWGHRILFHYEPQGGWGARLHWMIHGVHHDHPNDPLRLVMPPLMSLPIMLIAYGVGRLIVEPPATYAALAGFMAGYLAYDMVHYAVHHVSPRSGLGRKLRRLHMLHHFQDHTRSFGVSAPWWDVVFGTAPQKPAGPAQ
ncbi:MAG TPA: sterol desaturase family protein [Microvirga sp.]|jgi:sterol desaturase/sphingolipid hydroxylase (fatty acid hydroxylase superfamily)|nr:sterol desaturase family protein [Microvirga sp.]